jgi:hypothetical protein
VDVNDLELPAQLANTGGHKVILLMNTKSPPAAADASRGGVSKRLRIEETEEE